MCMHVYMYMYIFICAMCTYICVCMCMYICVYVCVCALTTPTPPLHGQGYLPPLTAASKKLYNTPPDLRTHQICSNARKQSTQARRHAKHFFETPLPPRNRDASLDALRHQFAARLATGRRSRCNSWRSC